MKTVILIPARYASSRYPGKPLAQLRMPGGERKSLIQLSWEAACRVTNVDSCHILTDDSRISDAAEAFGASVIMTSTSCRNGTERCAEAVTQGVIEADLIVNFQGDAPLTPPWFIERLIDSMKKDKVAQVATPVLRCDATAYRNFIEDRKADRVGGTTVVFDRERRALYFSKEVVPYLRPNSLLDPIPVFHHVGAYAYRPEALISYMDAPEEVLEREEGLEQLRFLENGIPVRCIEVEAKGRAFWELNNPEDVPRIEKTLHEVLL